MLNTYWTVRSVGAMYCINVLSYCTRREFLGAYDCSAVCVCEKLMEFGQCLLVAVTKKIENARTHDLKTSANAEVYVWP
jgi:hypothetical protein